MIAILHDKLQYTVVEERKDSIIGYSKGGGFQVVIRNDLIKEIVSEDKIASKKIPVWAFFDEEEMAYPGMADPADRWNGWAKPCFEKIILLGIMTDGGYQFGQESDDNIVFVQNRNDDIDDGVIAEKTDEGLYCIDGYTWDICNKDGQYICRDGSLISDDRENLLEKIKNYKRKNKNL
jgi:hypothetical protein